jgi:hypothetical protein
LTVSSTASCWTRSVYEERQAKKAAEESPWRGGSLQLERATRSAPHRPLVRAAYGAVTLQCRPCSIEALLSLRNVRATDYCAGQVFDEQPLPDVNLFVAIP